MWRKDITQSMLSDQYWQELDKTSYEFWVTIIRIHVVGMFILFLAVFYPLLPALKFGAELAIPTVQNETYHTIGLDPRYGYPIQLDGHLCWPADLNNCLLDSSSEDTCCTELYDKNAVIEQSVSDDILKVLIAVVSILFLVLRTLIWKCCISRVAPNDGIMTPKERSSLHTIDNRFWCKVLWDSLIAVGVSVLICAIVTEYVKSAIAAPRPNYYALQLFSSVHNSDRSSLEGT